MENRIDELCGLKCLQQDAMVSELRNVKSEVIELNFRRARIRATMRLADRIGAIVDAERRISKPESQVFK